LVCSLKDFLCLEWVFEKRGDDGLFELRGDSPVATIARLEIYDTCDNRRQDRGTVLK